MIAPAHEMQWLDPSRIAREEQRVRRSVEVGQGEHPVEQRETTGAHLSQQMKQDLRVGFAFTRYVGEIALLQLAPVVDLAIEDQNATGVVPKWLVTGRRQVEDAQARMTEKDIPNDVRAAKVRASMRQHVSPSHSAGDVERATKFNPSVDAAHSRIEANGGACGRGWADAR